MPEFVPCSGTHPNSPTKLSLFPPLIFASFLLPTKPIHHTHSRHRPHVSEALIKESPANSQNRLLPSTKLLQDTLPDP